MEGHIVTLQFEVRELERVIQALLDHEEGISALTDRLIDKYETLTDEGEDA